METIEFFKGLEDPIKKKKIIDLCNDKQLRTAIEVCGLADRKGRWILERKYLLLIGYAKMANLKYRR